jgi:hypothetical protein
MIGSPENNFQTMQPAQQEPNPRNIMLGNSMRGNSQLNMPRQPMQNMQQQSWQPNMMAPRQYGSPTPVMSNWQMPQSNASFNMQPATPGASNISYGQSPMQGTGYNTGLARPVPPLLGQ